MPTKMIIDKCELLRAVWYEVVRDAEPLHRRRGGCCDVEMRTATLKCSRFGVRETSSYLSGVVGLVVTGDCPCRDRLVDALVLADEFLSRGLDLINPGGAVRKHLRCRLRDLHRESRTRRGALAKPKTVVTNRHGRAQPDEFHRLVFELVVDEAGRAEPLDDPAHLHRTIAARLAKRLGGVADDYLDRVPDVLSTVEQVCRAGRRVDVGTDDHPELVTFWEAYVERPLDRRPPSAARLLTGLDDLGWISAGVADPAATVEFDRVELMASFADLITDSAADREAPLVAVFVNAARRAGQGNEESALRRVVTELVARGLLAARVATVLLADKRRVAVALTCLRELI